MWEEILKNVQIFPIKLANNKFLYQNKVILFISNYNGTRKVILKKQ